MQLGTRSSPQDMAFSFLEESDRRLADEAPTARDWASHARMIAALAEGDNSTGGETPETDVLSVTPFGVSTDVKK